MASMSKVFDIMLKLEFNNPANALHWNKNEKGYTYMGIYQVAHPKWAGWPAIRHFTENNSMEVASEKLYKDEDLTKLVKDFYKKQFWDRMRLDELVHQDVANEMFIFGVNAGCKAAVKAAQQVVGVDDDGLIGKNTIKALNECDAKMFDVEYDKKEIKHYEMLVAKNPTFKIYLNGWTNRAKVV